MLAEYDYIILGAGSAGCVLANRLSASGEFSVLVVEAGPLDNKLLIHIPAGVSSVYKDPSINWNYHSEAEPELAQRQIELPRGKVLGGSSSINSMVY
ncbi:MAG: choline dehydrogenase, partial [Gammaproteobacteria bacterium]|nr:choline dehydrogenase [Gammaproteobacteria bacterium]